ncbi:hypothetical protein SAMN05216360_105145 [Methylobacterium phyllostachyos]|uniref:Uncharacterized protein n=1 Tax=Methylobacterium phyllostachyos TaxID=582672 RepID=A0A1G9Y4H1_9HYPH|nr:hypothetical protein SAMN05216360_105145 [Methylobacterium phyllostachyos]
MPILLAGRHIVLTINASGKLGQVARSSACPPSRGRGFP